MLVTKSSASAVARQGQLPGGPVDYLRRAGNCVAFGYTKKVDHSAPSLLYRDLCMVRLFCLASLLLLLWAVCAWAEIKVCYLCGHEIDGKYWVYTGPAGSRTFCDPCYRLSPKCAACGVPSSPKSLTRVGKENLCGSCLARVKLCSLCGGRISGTYYSSPKSDEVFCNRCYHTFPRCRACDRPMRPHVLTRDGVCKSCADKLPACKSCGRTIIGAYFVHKFKGEYCWECQKKKPECYACGAPVGNIYWKLFDGRYLCDPCKKESIFREDQVRTIMDDVVDLVRGQLGLEVLRPWTLRVDRLNTGGAASVKAAREGLQMASPIAGNELGIFIERSDEREIVLLYGIPVSMVYETAAHELAHAWQAENCPRDQSAQLREGFAQWVASKVLQARGFTISLEKLQSRMDDPYGIGYQRMARIEAIRGRAGVLEYVRTATR